MNVQGSSSKIKENVSQKHEEEAEGSLQSKAVLKKGEMQSMLQTTGTAVAALLGGRVMDAVAADGPISLKLMPESIEAATRVPGWLGPSVLAFPVVSYFLFNIYREKVSICLSKLQCPLNCFGYCTIPTHLPSLWVSIVKALNPSQLFLSDVDVRSRHFAVSQVSNVIK